MARKRFHVKITAEDIRKADIMRVKRYEMWDAGMRTPEWMHLVHTDPIAYAIKRELPTAAVDVSYMGVIIDGEFYRLSHAAEDFIERYDEAGVIEPASFYLTAAGEAVNTDPIEPYVAPIE